MSALIGSLRTRLQEARQLLLNENLDASTAA